MFSGICEDINFHFFGTSTMIRPVLGGKILQQYLPKLKSLPIISHNPEGNSIRKSK